MAIYTAGFAEWSASEFFRRLKTLGVRQLIDVRLRPTSQLAGFAKKRDLEFFLREIVGADYLHVPALAPTADLLNQYRKREIDWNQYELQFLQLMEERAVENLVSQAMFEVPSLLLCSEHHPNRCHRRLVVEYLGRKWNSLGDVIHVT